MMNTRAGRLSVAAWVVVALAVPAVWPGTSAADEELAALRTKAESGDADAMARLGHLYLEGNEVEKDYAEALKWCTKAAEGGNGFGMYGMGLLSEGNQTGEDLQTAEARLARAAEWYIKAGEAGSGDAMYRMGVGVDADTAKAVACYRRAAELKHPKGTYELGSAYMHGLGVKADPTQAAKWFQKAAELGDRDAMSQLARMYTSGKGVRKNAAKAAEWQRKAEEALEKEVATLQAQEAKKRARLKAERGEDVSDETAFELTRKAAESGDAEAMVRLGLMYYRGKEVEHDIREAVRWYRKAADAGSARGMHFVGLAYSQGHSVDRDSVEAVRWYRKAADKGFPASMYYLGQAYHSGEGIERDTPEALKWYGKAADTGVIDAMLKIATIYETGRGVDKDTAEAAKWYRRVLATPTAESIYTKAAQEALDRLEKDN